LRYNIDDRQTTYEDENSHTTTTAIDVLGRGTSVTDAASGVVSTTFDKDNNVLTTEDQLGNLVTNVWNSSNELVDQDLRDPDGTGPLAAPVLYFT
jgi:YD repeat-containing protein